jgi:predicted DNA-binding protein (MmcQ/YjbR family)
MNVKWLRKHCLSFPGATENIQWGNDLVFKVGEKMFAVTCVEVGVSPYVVSFKCTPEDFGELSARAGIVPAPYLARAFWVALEGSADCPEAELKALLRKSYDLVVAGLPKKKRPALD